MKKVTDEAGNVIPGLLRDNIGSITVSDKDSYDRYLLKKSIKDKDTAKIKSLEEEILELKSLVNKLLNK